MMGVQMVLPSFKYVVDYIIISSRPALSYNLWQSVTVTLRLIQMYKLIHMK